MFGSLTVTSSSSMRVGHTVQRMSACTNWHEPSLDKHDNVWLNPAKKQDMNTVQHNTYATDTNHSNTGENVAVCSSALIITAHVYVVQFLS